MKTAFNKNVFSLVLLLLMSNGMSKTTSQEIKQSVKSGVASYQLTQFTIDNGGGKAIGGDFKLTSSIGQHDAHNAIQGQGQGTQFKLSPGFWNSKQEKGEIIFKDGFED